MTRQFGNTLLMAALAMALLTQGCGESEPSEAPEQQRQQEPEQSPAGEAAPATPDASIPTTPAERIDREGVNNLSAAGRFYFAGQPGEEALVALLEERGVRTVVNIRNPGEQTGMGMNERAVVEEQSARYETIPVSRSTFSRADVDRFAEIVESSPGPILVHCASSNRVGGLWAAYLATHHGVPLEEAIELGRSAGMGDSMEGPVRKVAGEAGAQGEPGEPLPDRSQGGG